MRAGAGRHTAAYAHAAAVSAVSTQNAECTPAAIATSGSPTRPTIIPAPAPDCSTPIAVPRLGATAKSCFTVDEYSAAPLIPMRKRHSIASQYSRVSANSPDVTTISARPATVTRRVGRLSAASPIGTWPRTYPSR